MKNRLAESLETKTELLALDERNLETVRVLLLGRNSVANRGVSKRFLSFLDVFRAPCTRERVSFQFFVPSVHGIHTDTVSYLYEMRGKKERAGRIK